MSFPVLILVAVILCFLFKVLNVNNLPAKSVFYCCNADFLDQILKHAPMLSEPYIPTKLWGFSGHIQTIIQSGMSRLHCPLVNGRRLFKIASDGATVTYDVYEPIERHSSNDDVTMAICPGICNSSESVYIRRVVYHAQLQGYRAAVLNHIGALNTVTITSPRIFNYGTTGDYHLMVTEILKRFPTTKVICVGFSMGANLVTKYLGEKYSRSQQIIAGISVCQGYDAKETTKYLLGWEGLRRVYFYIMTENIRSIIRRWQKQLFPEEVKQRYDINERAIWSAATLCELDDAYTRRISGYSSLDEMYKKSSCVTYWHNIKVPMVFVNALDDPIVPPALLRIVRNAAGTRENFMYVEQKYGGHLGFYQGGFCYPDPLTWLDRLVVQLSDGLVIYSSEVKGINETNNTPEQSVLKLKHNSKEAFTDGEVTSDSFGEVTSDSSGSSEDESITPITNSKSNRPHFLCRRRTVSGPQASRIDANGAMAMN